MSRRGTAIDEVAAAMRACWGPDPVSYEGKLYRIPPSEVNPKPVQQQIPILYAPGSEAAVRRAARGADGVFVGSDPDELRSYLRVFRDTARAAGRDPAGLPAVAIATVPITSRPMSRYRPFLGGSPEQITGDWRVLQDLRVDDVVFRNEAPEDLDEEINLMERLHAAARS